MALASSLPVTAPKPLIFSLRIQKIHFEDHPLGVQASVSARITVFAYSALMDKKKLLDAVVNHTFNKMGLLASEIEKFVESVQKTKKDKRTGAIKTCSL